MNNNKQKNVLRSRLLPGLIATILAGGITPAYALELGDATVRSAIGERLLVEIPFQTDSFTASSCFLPTLNGGPALGSVRVTQRGSSLILTTTRLIREPMLDLRIDVECAGTPRLRREYVLFIDPASRVSDVQRRISAAPVVVAQDTRRPRARRTVPAPVQSARIEGTQYEVQRGDSVSAIALRIKQPEQKMWDVVDDIVAANPDAFIDGDADRLLAGVALTLPAYAVTMNASAPATTASASVTPINSVASAATAPTEPEPTPPATTAGTPAPASDAPSSATAEQTRALMSVLQDAAAERAQRANEAAATPTPETVADASIADSPFKPLPAPVATPLPAPVTESAADAQSIPLAQSTTLLDRLVAMMLGMAGAIALWMLWQIASAGSRRKKRDAAKASLIVKPARTMSAPRAVVNRNAAVATPTTPLRDNEIEITRLDIDFGAVPDDNIPAIDLNLDAPLDAPETAVDSMAMDEQYADPRFATPIEVQELHTAEGTTAREALDAETQRLLEQDYEQQLTRTQQLNKEIAAKALGIARDDVDATAQLPRVDDDDATAQLPRIDDTEEFDALDETLSGVEALDEPTVTQEVIDDEDITANMSLDIDLDDEDYNDVSGLLRSPTDDIVNAELDEASDDFDNDRTEKLTRRAY
ncbi:MAG: hypothetical protein AAFO81_02320 [Pseudomonadota bacterium]